MRQLRSRMQRPSPRLQSYICYLISFLILIALFDTYFFERNLPLTSEQSRDGTMPSNQSENFFYRRRPTQVCPFRFNTVIHPKQDCDDDTFMVILTHSYHNHTDKRNATRQTWGGAATGKVTWPGKDMSKKIKMMFVFGQNRDAVWNARIKHESEIFDDVLVGNFVDAYANLTYKSLFGLKYVSEHCRGAKYLLKTDDDMIVNMPLLIDMLEKTPLTRSILGNQLYGKTKRSGKWALTRQQFPFDRFPTYEAGGAYVITSDIVRELFDTAEYVPQFFVDDLYVTGVLGKFFGVNHVHHPRLFWGNKTWGDKSITPCEIVKNQRLMQTKLSPSKLLGLWEEMKNVQCGV